MNKPNWTPFYVNMGFQVGGMVNMQCLMMHQLKIEVKKVYYWMKFWIHSNDCDLWDWHMTLLLKSFEYIFKKVLD